MYVNYIEMVYLLSFFIIPSVLLYIHVHVLSLPSLTPPSDSLLPPPLSLLLPHPQGLVMSCDPWFASLFGYPNTLSVMDQSIFSLIPSLSLPLSLEELAQVAPTFPVTPAQLMRPGIGRNVSYALSDWLISTCTCTCRYQEAAVFQAAVFQSGVLSVSCLSVMYIIRCYSFRCQTSRP